MTTHYATYFDRHYLSRGLALLESLRTHAPGAPVWVLCLDAEVERVLGALDLRDVHPVPLGELEARDPELRAVRPTRSLVEYYFTLTAPFLLDVLARAPRADTIAYIDADHYFFAPPSALTDPLATSSIVIIDHHYPETLADKYAYGRFNVGLLGFRRDDAALACLRWWRARCIEWCYDRLEGDRYGDQKYLDSWPTLFPGVHELDHKGVGVALWNAQNYRFRLAGGRVTIDGVPLVAYHYSSFRVLSEWLFDSGSRMYGYRLNRVMRRGIYVPYVRAIRRAGHRIRSVGGHVSLTDSLRGVPLGRLPGPLGSVGAKLYVLMAALGRRSLLAVTDSIAL